VKTQKGERKKWREILERCDFIFCFRSRETHFKLRAKTSNSELTSLQSSPPPFESSLRPIDFYFWQGLGTSSLIFSKGTAGTCSVSFGSAIRLWRVDGAHVSFLASAKQKINEFDA
jgi:hypothetical protein